MYCLVPVLTIALGVTRAEVMSARAADLPQPARAPASVNGPIHGIDRQLMDPQVAPGDDFFGYANGHWLATTPIPPDRDSWGLDVQLAEQVDAQVHGLLTSPEVRNAPVGSDPRKAADFFATFMDDAAIEAHGLAPLRPEFGRIAAVTNRLRSPACSDRICARMSTRSTTPNFIPPVFLGSGFPPTSITPDETPLISCKAAGVARPRLLPGRQPANARIREQYQAYIVSLLSRAKFSDAPARAARIIALETAMARVHATREKSEDARRANNPWVRAEFSSRAPGLEWPVFFEAAGLEHVDTIIVWHPHAIPGLVLS